MRLKIIEGILLIAIVLLVGGCDGDCLDFDAFLYRLFIGQYAVHCVDDFLGNYHPELVKDPYGILGPASFFVPAEQGQTASDFDCGTSVQSTTGPPLPHPKSQAAVPPGASSSPSAIAGAGPNSRVEPRASGQQYLRYGFNNGYVPPPAINPMIPAAIDPSAPPPAVSASCAPNSADVLFVNHLHNSVTRMGTCPFSTKAVIPLVSRPLQVAVTPDGSLALVTSFDNAVNFVNLATNTVSYTLMTSSSINPAGVAITPDGRRVYISSFNDTDPVILVIDIASHSIVTSIPAGAWAQGLYVSPDGSQLWVSYPFQNSIDIFDTATNTVVAGRGVNEPSGMAFNSTGTRAYVASGFGPGAIVAFDTATLKQVASYNVGTYPVDVNVIPGDRFVAVNNFGSANLSIIDTVTGMVVNSSSNGASSSLGLVLVQ